MALWDTPDLARRCKLRARRPVTDQAMPLANWYDFLTEAQPDAMRDLYSRFPDLQYSAPVLMTTADGGYTYTLGLDAAGDAIRPMGHMELYPNLGAIPDGPLVPGDDFLMEGSLIRMPGHRTRAFAGGPYARFVARPDVALDATHHPLIFPKDARILLVDRALEFWASRPGSGADPTYYAAMYKRHLDNVLLDLATTYNRQGAAGIQAYTRWWSLSDLGANGLQT